MRCPTRRPIRPGWSLAVAVLIGGSARVGVAQQAGPPAVPPLPGQAKLDAGVRFLEAKLYDQAAATLTEAIQEGAGSADAYYYRGEALRKTWWLGKAVADFDRALQNNLNHARSYFARGLAYEFLGYADKALADYTAALQRDRKAALAYIRRGGIHWKRGERERAKADLDYGIATCGQKIALNPNDAAPYRARALAYLTLEQYDQAAADLTEMIRLEPRDVEAYVERGRVWAAKMDAEASTRDFDAAVRLCNEAIQGNPSNELQACRQRALAHHARAFAWRQREDFEKAIYDFQKVSESTPGCAVAWLYLGQARGGAEHYGGEPGRYFDAALAAYGRAIELDAKFASAWHERGLLRTRRAIASHDAKHAEAAVADLSEVLRLVPSAAEAYCARGVAYVLLRDFERALADSSEAIRLCPGMADAYELRGRAYYALGKDDLARADLAKAEELRR